MSWGFSGHAGNGADESTFLLADFGSACVDIGGRREPSQIEA